MIFFLTCSSGLDMSKGVEIEVATIADLIALVEREKHPIIVLAPDELDARWRLEVYDYYRE